MHIHLYKSTGTSHSSRPWWDMSASQLGAQLRRQHFNAPKSGPDPNGSMMICECYHVSLIGYICAYMPLYAVILYAIMFNILQIHERDRYIYNYIYLHMHTDYSIVFAFTFLAGERVSFNMKNWNIRCTCPKPNEQKPKPWLLAVCRGLYSQVV